jgi:hypothetical protein
MDSKDQIIRVLKESLTEVVRDILDYEKINNLSPSPGREDCWQSVTRAKAVLRKYLFD